MPTKSTLKKLSTFLLLGIVAAFLVHYFHVQYGRYDYSTKEDYELALKNVETVFVDIVDGSIILDGRFDSKGSHFLKIKAESTILGKFKDPSIEINSNSYQSTNFFELGFKGTRYLDLTQHIKEGTKQIQLEGNFCDIPNQSAQIISSPSPFTEKGPLLIVAPHADDAEIAAFGLYKDYDDVFILTITAGADNLFKYDEVYNDELKHNYKKAELRTWNSITVGKLGGVPTTKTLNLGYFIHGLEPMKNGSEKKIVESPYLKTNDITNFHNLNESPLKDSIIPLSNWKSLVANIQMVLRNVKPKNIVTAFPDLDRHEDHKMSSWALFQAIRNEGITEGNLLLYSTHQLHCGEWYPYGPQGSAVSVPPIFERDDIIVDGLFSFTLNGNLQKDKIFALEAMNDLRPDTDWLTWKGTLKTFAKKTIKGIYGYDKTYFRRNVRCNEFFFVKKISSLVSEQAEMNDKEISKN